MIPRFLAALAAVMALLGKHHLSSASLLAIAAVVLGAVVLTLTCVRALQALEGHRPGFTHRPIWSTS